MPYGGIKVLEIPVEIISATDSQTGKADLLFSGNYGLAFVGHYLAAFLFKELASEVLRHGQYIGSANTISFEIVCNLVSRFHEHFYQQIKDHLTTNHELDFFLGGFCPSTGKVRVAKFSVNSATRQSGYQEVLQGGGFSFETIGVDDGQAKFRELMNLSLLAPCPTHLVAFRRLWDVIRDPEVKFVKGAAQYGDFKNGSFALGGVFDVVRENQVLQPKSYIRGTDIELINLPNEPLDLHIHYSYANPFDQDINSFEYAEMYSDRRGGMHVVDEQISILPYNAKWVQWFQDERDFLRMQGIDPNIPVEHVGSTAVPGMAAVPHVDLLIGADFAGDVHAAPFDLSEHGYEYLGDKLANGYRCYRKRGKNRGEKEFNLFVAPPGSEFWNRTLKLRDYLRQRDDERDAFIREKVRILNAGSWTLVRYLKQRANYLAQLLARSNQ